MFRDSFSFSQHNFISETNILIVTDKSGTVSAPYFSIKFELKLKLKRAVHYLYIPFSRAPSLYLNAAGEIAFYLTFWNLRKQLVSSKACHKNMRSTFCSLRFFFIRKMTFANVLSITRKSFSFSARVCLKAVLKVAFLQHQN